MENDGWKYSDLMKKYLFKIYGFKEIKAARRVDDNVMIFLCTYNNNDTKIYRHSFNVDEMKKIYLIETIKI